MASEDQEPGAPLGEAAYLARHIDDLPQLWDGFAKLVREGLGISGFGVQTRVLCVGGAPGKPYEAPGWTTG